MTSTSPLPEEAGSAASSEQDLFRTEALDHAYSRWGQVAQSPGVASWLLTAFMLALLVVVALFLILGSYSRRETVLGSLSPSGGALRIVAPKQGVVTTVDVSQDQVVQRGATILTLNTDPVLAGSGSAGTQLLASAQRERDAQQEAGRARLATIARQKQAAAAQRSGLLMRRKRLVDDLALARSELALRQETLASAEPLMRQGYFSVIQYRQRQEAVLEARKALSAIEAQQEDVRAQLLQLNAQDEQLTAEAQVSAAQNHGEDAQFDEKQVTLSASREILVTAPRAGRIAVVNAKVGGPVESSAALAVLVPTDSVLQAELWAPSRAAGFVRPGDAVRLMYDAFPYQRFGAATGRVISVANAPTPPNELPLVTPSPEALYRVTVRLDRQSVNAYGKAWSLTAGARLTADLVLEKRSFLEWILEPVLSVERRGR